jgi:hypothetical protein
MWTAAQHAGLTSDAQDPLLPLYAAGTALQIVTGSLADDKRNHRVTRGHLMIAPTVASATPLDSPVTVNIADCVDDSDWLKYNASGGLADKDPGGRHHTTAVVQHLGGWKVVSFALDGRIGSC